MQDNSCSARSDASSGSLSTDAFRISVAQRGSDKFDCVGAPVNGFQSDSGHEQHLAVFRLQRGRLANQGDRVFGIADGRVHHAQIGEQRRFARLGSQKVLTKRNRLTVSFARPGRVAAVSAMISARSPHAR